ncbi:MAG: bifunctional folylpolyglutamate synthase/dihydrofolate synthase [Pseudomonadales bacterium]|nr:bifunctional folylpolyglutamate synthase/dihydrofolate synthase [Pseudomonadales bacterium]
MPEALEKKPRSLAEWLAWQEQLHPSEIDLGLDRVKEVAGRLALLDPCAKTLTVGGTNGKGSTVLALETLLLSENQRVGSYTSPHLRHYNERVRLNGKPVDDAVLVEAFERVDEARAGTSLTYFEFGTLAALLIFKQAKVDFQVLEVGLGGRLDAVNIIDADVAIVTNVSVDHESWLGNDRESIAKEKIGIYRKTANCLYGESDLPAVFRFYREEGNALCVFGEDFSCDPLHEVNEKAATSQCLQWQGACKGEALKSLVLPSLGMSPANAACAIQAMCCLGFRVSEAWGAALHNKRLPGRYQRKTVAGRKVILDVAHNQASVACLIENLGKEALTGKFRFVVSVLADKDHQTIFSQFANIANRAHWYLAPVKSTRSCDVTVMSRTLQKCLCSGKENRAELQTFDTIPLALESAINSSLADDLIVVFGSFYTVSEALEFLETESI